MSDIHTSSASLKLSPDQMTVQCLGDWTVTNIAHLPDEIKKILKHTEEIKQIDASHIESMDSAGALLLNDMAHQFKKAGKEISVAGLRERRQELFNIIGNDLGKVHKALPEKPSRNGFYVVGVWGHNKYIQAINFFAFVGEFWFTLIRSIVKPRRIQWRSIISTIDLHGYQALPILALMTFLIGIVLAYQVAEELRRYGADIFVVDITGIGIVREFGPLITAIILAGRTSTSFAALIGTMKVNEEIDALNTMGLSPIDRLVLPRIIGLIIAMPLLTVWADLFGILGSMIMSKNLLHINFVPYLERFQESVGLRNYALGLIKTPFFALIIAAVGCFQGFQVSKSAESVGYQTTKAAVQAIFLIIIADAGFSILFRELGY